MKKFLGMVCLAVLFAATGEARGGVIDFTLASPNDQSSPASWQTEYDIGGVDVQFNSAYKSWFDDYNDFEYVAFNPTGTGPLIIDFVGPVRLNSFGLGNFKGESVLPTSYQIFDLADLVNPVIDSGSFVVPYSDLTKPTYNVNVTSFTGIRLQFQGDPNETLAIDDISFAPVPEPVTMVIWGIGACGMGILARRKKKQTA